MYEQGMRRGDRYLSVPEGAAQAAVRSQPRERMAEPSVLRAQPEEDQNQMKITSKALLLAIALAATPLAAQARDSVVIDFGNVAFGYRDGYWDRGHNWHRWEHAREREHYRRAA